MSAGASLWALMGIRIPGDSALWEPEREHVLSMAQPPSPPRRPSLRCTLSAGVRPSHALPKAKSRPENRNEVAPRCCLLPPSSIFCCCLAQ